MYLVKRGVCSNPTNPLWIRHCSSSTKTFVKHGKQTSKGGVGKSGSVNLMYSVDQTLGRKGGARTAAPSCSSRTPNAFSMKEAYRKSTMPLKPHTFKHTQYRQHYRTTPTHNDATNFLLGWSNTTSIQSPTLTVSLLAQRR